MEKTYIKNTDLNNYIFYVKRAIINAKQQNKRTIRRCFHTFGQYHSYAMQPKTAPIRGSRAIQVYFRRAKTEWSCYNSAYSTQWKSVNATKLRTY